jgi:hypothetical protein
MAAGALALHCHSHPACTTTADAGSAVSRRDGGRTFPSLFAAWSPAENLNDLPDGPETPLCESKALVYARHDLVWQGYNAWGLNPADGAYQGEATAFAPASIARAQATTAALRRLNPNIRLLAEIRYHDAQTTYLPADSPWWLRASDGSLVPTGPGSDAGYYELNFHDPTLQAQVGRLCSLVMQTGALDGCFLDWWNDVDTAGGTVADRAAIAANVRAALGDSGLLVVNVNGTFPPPSTAPFINGLYMEGYNSSFFPLSSWQTAAQIMLYAVDGTGNLHSPSFSAFEGWYPSPSSGSSTAGRNDYSLMRLTTALSLVFSDGYVLFGDPDGYPGGDHNHDVYVPLWSDAEGDHPLGYPMGPPVALDAVEADGSFRREFTRGTVVLNPPGGSTVTVTFPSPRWSLGSNAIGTRFSIAAADGDAFVNAQ